MDSVSYSHLDVYKRQEFDYIAMSFVRNAAHMQELRDIFISHNVGHIGIISKVENQE